MSKSKAEAIREVLSEADFGLTNRQIKDQIRERYGLIVESNEIGNIGGSYRDRLAIAGHSQHLLKVAGDFLRLVGDQRLAIALIRQASHV
jgi:hypothetical protein